jgi:putative methyltransferase (TIGR04325 family)
MTAELSPTLGIRRVARRLTAIVKSMVPRALLDAIVSRTNARGPIWEGVYARFRDVPVEDDAYATPAYLDSVEQFARAALSAWRSGQKLNLWHDSPALVAACVARERHEIVVVDFGGGLGTGYLHMKHCLPTDVQTRYLIIEIPDLVARGRELFAGIDDVSFYDALTTVSARPDIVYVNSALQYVEDYAAVLGQMADLQPNWILLDRTAAGDVPSFVTRQLNVDGKAMRYWFLDKHEIASILAKSGYQLAHEAEVGPKYDQHNLPPSHRIPRMRNFLFCRASQHEPHELM